MRDLLAALTELRERLKEIPQAGERRLKDLKTEILGRKAGALTKILATLPRLEPADRKEVGAAANALKQELEAALEARARELKRAAAGVAVLDLTMPGRARCHGGLHLVTQVVDEICEIFRELGFTRAVGPEAETEWYNFGALNFPKDHPAIDAQDSFYLDTGDVEGYLLRTHTSPVQVRYMEANQPPLKIIAPGRVYRCDSDVTHSPMFHQVEGLWIAEEVSFAMLKGVLADFMQQFFEREDLAVRFRPSFFPFTEPSAEMDIACVMCNGAGCRVCSHTGWLEVLGSGMVHPNVLKHVNIDSEKYLGFAFGLGVERLAMLRYGVNDLRLFYESDLRFLKQFN